jgi:hypothetical protein
MLIQPWRCSSTWQCNKASAAYRGRAPTSDVIQSRSLVLYYKIIKSLSTVNVAPDVFTFVTGWIIFIFYFPKFGRKPQPFDESPNVL